MRILLLIPAILFFLLLLINLSIFSASSEINFFWLAHFNMPVALFVSLFFILYIFLVWLGFNVQGSFANRKVKKVENENFDLKNKLLNKQGDLISSIETKFSETFEKYQIQQDKKLELYKKENEKMLSNMNFEMEKLGNKIEKLKK